MLACGLLNSHHPCIAGDEAAVHIIKGGEERPTRMLPVVRGQVDVGALEQAENVHFEQVAVVQGGDVNARPTREDFQRFRHYRIAVQPGQEVFLKAKPAGMGGRARGPGIA